MTRGAKRKFNPSIPRHIDQTMLPKGIYWLHEQSTMEFRLRKSFSSAPALLGDLTTATFFSKSTNCAAVTGWSSLMRKGIPIENASTGSALNAGSCCLAITVQPRPFPLPRTLWLTRSATAKPASSRKTSYLNAP